MNFDYKKAYYYIIALITFFVLLWGVIDFASAATAYFTGKPQAVSQEEFNLDRIYDSIARIVVAGGIFFYSKWQIKKLEEA